MSASIPCYPELTGIAHTRYRISGHRSRIDTWLGPSQRPIPSFMPSIGIGYGNFSSNRRLQQVFAGQSVSSRPPRHSEQLSLYFSQTLCGTFSNGILRPRISQHHGRVNIVHAVPLRRRCRTAPLQRNNTCNRAGSFRTSRYRYSPHSCIRRAGRHLSGRRADTPSAAPPIPCLYNNRFRMPKRRKSTLDVQVSSKMPYFAAVSPKAAARRSVSSGDGAPAPASSMTLRIWR